MGNKNSKNQVHIDHPQVKKHDIIDHFEIVWLDERPREDLLQDQHYSKQIESLQEYNLRFFRDYIECGTYLYKLSTCAKVILLIQEQLADDIVHAANSLCPVKFIFIVHPISIDTSHQENVFSQYVKVKHVSFEQVTDQIHFFEARFLRSTKEFFSIDIFKANQALEISSTRINGSFLFTQLLLDILLRMEPKSTDKDELIARCSDLFVNNPAELKKLEEFHLDYKQEKVFECYSKDSFVYRLLNKALRTQNIDLLFLFRFVLQDLQSQLVLHQECSPVCVYRGQQLSKKEWEDLFNANDQFISMNSILSTSLQKNVAEYYILGNDTNVKELNKVMVMFQIEANPHLSGGVKPFANISRYSQFPIEDEIIFMAGCIFRVIQVINGDPLSIVRMELCSNEENDLKSLFQSMRSEFGGKLAEKENEASLNSFGQVLFAMERFQIADRFFRRIYYETSIHDSNRALYCMNIGAAVLQFGQYDECIRWYDRSFELYKANGLLDHPIVARLHVLRGILYTMMNRRREALESYNTALSILQINFGENHPQIAACYNNMGRLFERRKYFRIAIEYHERALRIAEKTLPIMHPTLVFNHLALSKLALDLRHRDVHQALHHAQIALQIANTALPADHPNFLEIYATLSKIYRLMGDIEQSIIWRIKIESLRSLHSTGFVIQRTERVTKFICSRCYRYMWIYRRFEWMKDSRLNCLVFHDLRCFLLDIKRYCCHY